MQSLARNGYTEAQVLQALQGLYAPRQITFRYELLDDDNTLLDELDNVLDGSITYDSLAEIKGTAGFTIAESPTSATAIDYLKHRIKPYVRLQIPALPVEGELVPATTYEEAVDNINTVLARWKFDELSGTTAHDEVLDLHPITSPSGQFNKTAVIEDEGRSLRLNNQTATVNRAGDFLNSRTAFSFAGWFQSETVGSDKLLFETTTSGSWADIQDMTWNDLNALTWDQIEALGAGSDPQNDTWDSIEATTLNWQDLGVWDNLLVTTISGMQCTFIGSTKNIKIRFYVNDIEVTATTPVNTQTTDRTFFVFTWTSGGDLVLYLNGEEVTRVPSAVTGGLENVGDLVIGSNFTGRIDDWMFTSGVLTPDAIHSLYVTGAGIGPAAGPDHTYVEWPQGIYLLSSPTREIDAGGVITRDVDAYDQTVVLDSEKTEDNYYVSSGTLYTDAIEEVLTTVTGIPSYSITRSTLTLPAQKVWDAGTSYLKILNDLLAAINYEPVFFDADGVAQVQPYIDPQSRAAEYTYDTGLTSVLIPEATQGLDLFKQYNRWVLIVSEPDRPLLKSTFTNTDPSSPTSTVNRGRIITQVKTEQDVADQTTLDAKVLQLAQEASQVYEELDFKTAIMPFHAHRDVIHVSYPQLAVEANYSETKWSYKLEAGAKMAHSARRIISLGS